MRSSKKAGYQFSKKRKKNANLSSTLLTFIASPYSPLASSTMHALRNISNCPSCLFLFKCTVSPTTVPLRTGHDHSTSIPIVSKRYLRRVELAYIHSRRVTACINSSMAYFLLAGQQSCMPVHRVRMRGCLRKNVSFPLFVEYMKKPFEIEIFVPRPQNGIFCFLPLVVLHRLFPADYVPTPSLRSIFCR